MLVITKRNILCAMFSVDLSLTKLALKYMTTVLVYI